MIRINIFVITTSEYHYMHFCDHVFVRPVHDSSALTPASWSPPTGINLPNTSPTNGTYYVNHSNSHVLFSITILLSLNDKH